MVIQNAKPADPTETQGSGETDRLSRLRQTFWTVIRHNRNGMVTALAGGLLLADAARTVRRDKLRAGVFALGGGVLFGVGLRQRRSEESASTNGDDGMTKRDDTESTGVNDGERKVSDEARAHRERSDALHQSERNPRGVSGEPDVETETDPDERDIQFTTEQEVVETAPKPHLDSDEQDPRHNEDDPETADGHVTIDLSESAMADEASEATGPADEQSYPAREGTDPEPMSEKAPPRVGQGAVSNTDPNSDDHQAGDENQEGKGESENNDDERT